MEVIEVLLRDAGGSWRRLALPADALIEPGREWVMRGDEIEPLGRGRALVLRDCTANNHICTRALLVDTARNRVTLRRFLFALGPASADGRGGVWVRFQQVAPLASQHVSYGFARLVATPGFAIDAVGLPAETRSSAGDTTFIPQALAAIPTGFAAATGDGSLYLYDRAGVQVTRRPQAPRDDAMRVADLCLLDDELVQIGRPAFAAGREEYPLYVRRITATGSGPDLEVPTPRWWRLVESRWLRAVPSGRVLWIHSPEALFVRSDRWHTVEAVGAREGAERRVALQRNPPWTRSTQFTLPINLGLARKDGDIALALAVRPEKLWQRGNDLRGLGIGLFTELGTVGGPRRDSHAALGLTVGASGQMYDVTLSAGGELHRFAEEVRPQAVLSAFAGWRYSAFGLRIDARPPTDALPGSVTVSAAIDPAISLAILLMAIFPPG